MAVSINKQNYTHEFIRSSRRFTVSILEEATPMTMIEDLYHLNYPLDRLFCLSGNNGE